MVFVAFFVSIQSGHNLLSHHALIRFYALASSSVLLVPYLVSYNPLLYLVSPPGCTDKLQ
jgi:hypothetical protein